MVKDQGLDDTTLIAEIKYLINFEHSGKILVSSLHYNGSNSFLFVNTSKLYHFKAKDSEIKDYTLFLGNISKDFTINNMKKTGLRELLKFFSVDSDAIVSNGILDIYRYLMEET